MATSELPDDILIEIFSRLPAKSVGKCRCLARQWRTLLSTPQFIKSHLTRKPHQESLLLITPSQSIRSIDAIKDGRASRKLELPSNWSEVVGSCDGLVLLLNEDKEMFLVNPITLQQMRIPDSPLVLNRAESCSMHGFGYDSIGDDYKIVKLSYYDAVREDGPHSVDICVHVYSVKRGIWRRAGISPYNRDILGFPWGAFVNGAIHWHICRRISGSRYFSVIAAFDLAHEVFYEIPTPNGEQFLFGKLVVLGGCLCLVDVQTNNQTDIWIMEEYGLVESWTNFSVPAYQMPLFWHWKIVKPLCYIGDEEVVLATELQRLVVYHREGNTLRDLIVDGFPAARFIDACIFVGSLISPAFMV